MCLLLEMDNLQLFDLHYFNPRVYFNRVIVVVVRLVIGDPVKLGRLFSFGPFLARFTAILHFASGINTLDLIQSRSLISAPLGTVHVRAI